MAPQRYRIDLSAHMAECDANYLRLTKLAPDLAKSPLVNPPAELRARLHIFRGLEEAEDQEFNKIFQDAVGA